jgi:hypothetical protein
MKHVRIHRMTLLKTLIVVSLIAATLGLARSPAAALPAMGTQQDPTTIYLPLVLKETDPRPEESIMILTPGPGSRVTSPVTVAGEADPTFEQHLLVRVLQADGTLVTQMPTIIQAELGQRGPFSVELPIDLDSEQNIFIQVLSDSARDGNVTHLSSVGVTFTPAGPAEINEREPYPEQIHISQPQTGATVSGGSVHVTGFALASFEQTLVVEVYDEDGDVIASEPVMVQAPDLGQPGPFEAHIEYSLSTAGPGRIVVRDESPAFGGDAHLSSVEVSLEP